MTQPEPSQDLQRKVNHYPITVTLFGPLRPAEDLDRLPQRVIKSHSNERDHFTEIRLIARNAGEMTVEYYVKALSPKSASRVGVVYLSQLCDLLSVVTQCPIKFYHDSDVREERGRLHRQAMRVDRTLTSGEW